MPFNWLKRKTTAAIAMPRLPIKVAQIATSGTPSPVNGSKAEMDNRNPERLRNLDEPIECDQDNVKSHPQGRCGFTTCFQDETLKSAPDMIEEQSDKRRQDNLFRNRVLAAESLEECLKIIEAEAANLTFEEPQKEQKTVETHNSRPVFEKSGMERDQCPEEHDASDSDDFSLWGNRIIK